MTGKTPVFINIRLDRAAGRATIVLDRPGRINAYTAEMYREIRSAVRIADADPKTAVIVFRAEGDVFGAGGDLEEMLSFLDAGDPELIHQYQDDLPFAAVRACRKPTLAAVRGTCVGGGFGLATACDLVVAEAGTRIGIPEARVGLIDGLAIAALYGHVPLQALRYLLFTGTLIDASEAMRLGMVFDCVPPERFEGRVGEIAAELAASSPDAVAEYKRILRTYDRPDHITDLMAMLTRNPETAGRIRSFFDRPRGSR
jgi:enoyl-CoA hydratase/carnithine racemase